MAVSKLIPSLLAFVLLVSLVCADQSIISSITPSALSTTAAELITITGTGFNAVTAVTIDGIACSIVHSDSENIICDAPAGLGSGRPVVVTATPSLTSTVDYEVATASLCSGSMGEVLVNTAAATVTICGEHFGDSAIVAQSGWTGKFAVYVGSFLATITHHDDQMIIFTPPTSAVGKQLAVKVTFGTNVVHIDGVTFTYPGPVVTSVKTIEGLKRSTTQRVAVFGRHFGTPGPNVHDTVRIGDFACVSVLLVSDSEIHCTVTGFGANREVIVTVNGQSSPSQATSTGGSAVRYDFANPMTPGLACSPPNGAADIINDDMCNCFSGYASLDPVLATECSVHAMCPGHVTSVTTIAEFPPSRPVTQFKDDHLYITQTMPIVKNRRDTVIQFVIPAINATYMNPVSTPGSVGASTCFYPGTLWQKQVNELDCLDEFYGVMPWTQNALCGFVEDTHNDPQHRNFKSSLVTSYTETFKKTDGTLMFRKISNAYLVSISYVRHVTALTSTSLSVVIADQTDDVSLQVAVIGDALYDVATMNTIITFETTIVWPYQINNVALNGTWTKAAGNTDAGSIIALAELSSVQSGDMVCDMTQDTDCSQSWVLIIQTNAGPTQACNLMGLINFPTQNLLCRDLNATAVPCPQTPSTSFSISIGKTDLCDGSAELDATAGLTHVMDSFFDSALTVPQNVFQTGDMIYFQLIVNDPLSTIDMITFNSVQAVSSDHSHTDTLVSVDSPSSAVSGADFNITQEFTGTLAPGMNGMLSFQFRLNRNALTVVNALSSVDADDMTKQLTVQAAIDIFYHGNQKRTLVAAGPIPSISHSQISFYDFSNEMIADDVINESPVEEEILSIFQSSASMTTATFVAAVGAAALILA